MEATEENRATLESIWNASAPAPENHPFLKKRGIKPRGVRVFGNDLIVRMNDGADKIDSLLFLSRDNGNGAVTSLGSPYCHCIIGDVADIAEQGGMYVALNYVSGTIIHEATGDPVMVTWNPNHAYDLMLYAREKYDPSVLVLCLEYPLMGSDDGMDEACCSVAKFDGMLAILPQGVKTWVELRQRRGMKAVFNCAAHPVNLPEEWKVDFQALVASWKNESSALIASEEDPTPSPQPRRYPLLTAGALSKTSLSQYRVKNVLPREGIAAIFGPPGVAKSFLALDLAFAISDRGGEWCGYRVKECDGLYLCLEGQGGLAQRVQAYREHYGQDTGKRIRFITAPFSLLYQDDVGALADTAKEAGIRGGVIIIDTLSAASPGADENSSVDMGRILQALKRIVEECGGLVILVHHSGKDAQKGLRGHSSLLAALDAVIEVRREDDRRSWRLLKSKDGLDGKEHSFRLSIVELGIDEDGDQITSCVIESEERSTNPARRTKAPKGTNQKVVYEVLGELLRRSSDHGKGGAPTSRPCVRLDDLIDACHGRIAVDNGRIPERVRLAVNGMVSTGCLVLRDGWIYLP